MDVKIHCKYDELVDLDKIKLNPQNRNNHSDSQIKRLAELIEYYGTRHPIIVSKQSNLVVAGEGRYLAFKKLGETKLPVNWQDFDSPEQEYGFGISDNAIASWAELDLAAINYDLQELGPDFDLDMLGIKDFVLEPCEKYGDKDADAVPGVQDKAISKEGDLIILGEHRLLCGDCTDKSNVDRLMDGQKADMVFTDPPYDFETKGGGLFKNTNSMKQVKENKVDKFNPETLTLHAQTNIFFHNKSLIKKYIELAQRNKVSYDLAVYHKTNITPNYSGHLMTDIEYIAILGRQDPNKGFDKLMYSKLYSGNKDKENELSYSKPVELCEKFIKLYSKDNVLDQFCGSGSTLIACEKTNRKCFMMEIDPHYVDVIISRWCQYTDNYDILINGDKVKWQDEN